MARGEAAALKILKDLCIDLGQQLFEGKRAPGPIEPPQNSANI
jgi:hypothetical protein